MTVRHDLDAAPAIVTGAGQGIGRATATRLATVGARLVLTDIDRDALEDCARECRNIGSPVSPVAGDIADASTADAVVGECLSAFGAPRIVVNNAGIVRPGPIADLTDRDWHDVLEVNLSAAFRLLRACAAPMISSAQAGHGDPRSNGKIVNISSIDGLFGAGGQVNYSAAKAGLIGLTMALAREWARYRINVNAVAPGGTITAMSEPVWADEVVRRKLLSTIPLRRLADPDEIAGCVLFLAGPDSDYITGQTLSVCGGLRIAP